MYCDQLPSSIVLAAYNIVYFSKEKSKKTLLSSQFPLQVILSNGSIESFRRKGSIKHG